jgi:hypothetical protein
MALARPFGGLFLADKPSGLHAALALHYNLTECLQDEILLKIPPVSSLT